MDNGYGSVVLRYDTNMQFDDVEANEYHGLFEVYEDGTVHKNFIYFSEVSKISLKIISG